MTNEIVEKTYTIDPIACEGCGVCVEFCPVDAIKFEDTINGQWFVSESRFGPFIHARLGIAEENSGKLVTLIRKQAKIIAKNKNKNLIIVDGSPGIGCPVIASISGADMVLVVTEPTISGRHDLNRVIELTKHFKIPTAVCINKYDINSKIAENIEKETKEKKLKLLGKIPYDTAITEAQIKAKSIIEYSDNHLTKQIISLWEKITKFLNAKAQKNDTD